MYQTSNKSLNEIRQYLLEERAQEEEKQKKIDEWFERQRQTQPELPREHIIPVCSESAIIYMQAVAKALKEKRLRE